jgi:hypothetical protein
MHFFRYVLAGLALLISTSLMAQFIRWEGPALWLKREGATETFLHLQIDTTRIPEGAYAWEWVSRADSLGKIEMVKINGAIRKGMAEGDFQLVGYILQPRVVNFDADKAVVNFEGKRLKITGKFTKGQPTGLWRFEEEGFPDAKTAINVLTLQVGGEWNFRGNSGSIRGQINSQGTMKGPWVIRTGNAQWEPVYERGILVDSKGATGHEAYFHHQRAALALADSVIIASEQPWVWTDGFGPEDEKWKQQEPMAATLHQANQVFAWAQTHLATQQWFRLPANHGTGRLYFGLSPTHQSSLEKTLLQVSRKDTLLLYKLQLPSFVLRRNSSPSLDSLMATTETCYQTGQQLLQQIEKFLSPEGRTVAPHFWGFANASNHRQVAELLQQQGIDFLDQATALYQLLEIKQESLRQLSAIEDLEEEWALLLTDLNQLEEKEVSGTFAHKIWLQLVSHDLEARNQPYASLEDPIAKKTFLTQAIKEGNWLLEFFQNHSYRDIEKIPEQIKEAFTRWLYNPYMGVNNIEQTVKKKLFNTIQSSFWPQVTLELERAKSVGEFKASYEEAMWLGELLIHLGRDDSAAATRMEKRGRNEKSKNQMATYLKEYAQEAGVVKSED